MEVITVNNIHHNNYIISNPRANNYTDGRGNVDDESDDGAQPEAFNPEYESLPALRPSQPPPYKQTPGYEHGGKQIDNIIFSEKLKMGRGNFHNYVQKPFLTESDV